MNSGRVSWEGSREKKRLEELVSGIEMNKPLTEGNGSIFKLLVCCFGHSFTSGFCEVLNNDCVLTTRLKVAFYGSFWSIPETGGFSVAKRK